MNNSPKARLDRKLARLNADLAPEDDCIEHAHRTAQLRRDPAYLDKWVEFHKAHFPEIVPNSLLND